MAYLAEALTRLGHDVTYVAEEEIAAERVALGWQMPDLRGVTLRFARTAVDVSALVEEASVDTVHLTQGLRSNGSIAFAQAAIRGRRQRHFAMIETVDQRGVTGLLKLALYFWHLHVRQRRLDGVLAIGVSTPAWLRRLAPADLPVCPFAYFLAAPPCGSPSIRGSSIRFLFVGSLIPLKRLDLLLQVLAYFTGCDFEVQVVGDGPMRKQLEAQAERVLPGRVTFHGVRPISEIPSHMAKADCLVLPSIHDGWGAVVSEALMVGTPVICSDACGSAGVVRASGFGGVFRRDDRASLKTLLDQILRKGQLSCRERNALASWATCLGDDAGAVYLLKLLEHAEAGISPPLPPWEFDSKSTNWRSSGE